MSTDTRIIELLADMVIKLDKLDNMAVKLDTVVEEQIAMRKEFGAASERNTQAILALTAMLQKTVIEPAQRQADDISDLKRRVTILEQAH